jgi:hypothetical protein
MMTFLNLILLLQPMIVNSAFLIVDGCNTFSNQDSCIKNYGCGWCNSTNILNTSITFTTICKEINICPLSNDNSDEICVINSDYYYKFNCFLSKFIVYSLLIFGFIMIMTCIYLGVLYSIKNQDGGPPKNYGLLSCMFLLICISGACLLFVNDYIFSNFIFVLIIISCSLPCIFYIKKRERQINYQDEDYDALLISVNDNKNENPPIYKD